MNGTSNCACGYLGCGKIPTLLCIHRHRVPNLMQIGRASSLLRALLCSNQCGKENCNQQSNDGDDNKKLNKGESSIRCASPLHDQLLPNRIIAAPWEPGSLIFRLFRSWA